MVSLTLPDPVEVYVKLVLGEEGRRYTDYQTERTVNVTVINLTFCPTCE